jgi:hypothetical protein
MHASKATKAVYISGLLVLAAIAFAIGLMAMWG